MSKWGVEVFFCQVIPLSRDRRAVQMFLTPATPVKGNGVATQSDDAQTRGVILDSQSSGPSSISLPSIDPHDLLYSQLSRTSSAQSLTPTPGVMKKGPYKRAIWEMEPVVEWLENNVDGSFFSNRL